MPLIPTDSGLITLPRQFTRGFFNNLAAGGESFGNALKFDGVNDRVLFTQIEILASESHTIQFWFKPAQVAENQILIDGSGSSRMLQIQYVSDLILVKHSSGVANFTTPTFVIGTWYHIIISRIIASMRAYIDNVESTTGAVNIVQSQNYNAISNGFSDRDFKGDIDEFAIEVGTGATVLQVAQLYNNRKKSDFIAIMGGANVYYEMNQSGSDPLAIDTSINGNDGALTDFTLPGPWVEHIAD